MLQHNERPVIHPAKKTIDYFFEISAILAVVFMWSYAIYHYQYLPEIIPTHFGTNGMADDYGSRKTIFLLPAIVSGLIILLRFANHFPHKFNYMVTITAENAEKQYRLANRLIRYLQFIISMLFAYILINIVNDAHAKTAELNMGFIVILMIAVMSPSFFMVYLSLSQKSKKKS